MKSQKNQKEETGTIKRIFNTPFHCEYPWCSMFTDEGYEYKGKKYCVGCFKKVEKEEADAKTNNK